jgi:hypothetical protein
LRAAFGQIVDIMPFPNKTQSTGHLNPRVHGPIFDYPYCKSALFCGSTESYVLERIMKTKYKNLPLLGLGLAISLSCTSSAVAADVAGFTSGTLQVLSTTPLKNGRTAARLLYLVGIVTDTQEGPFHGGTQQCLATVINNADGSLVEGHGACDGIDPDGDVWWISLSMADDSPIRWTITGGTGKYEGLAMSGVNNQIAQHADGIVLGRFEGNHAEN